MIFVPVLPMFILQLTHDASRVNGYTGLSMGILSAATALFAVVLGRLGDRVGYQKILIACSLGCSLFFALHLSVQSVGYLLVLQALIGVAMGGLIPGISALFGPIHPPGGTKGAPTGLDTSIISGARAAGPMIGVGVSMWLGAAGGVRGRGSLVSGRRPAGLFQPAENQESESVKGM